MPTIIDGEEIPFNNDPKVKSKKKPRKMRKWKLIALLILIAAIAGGTTYGLSRPGVMTAVRSAIRYASPEVQKKAWNEAQREVLEAEIKGRQDKLEEVKPQSFWRPEIINTAHAQEQQQIQSQSEPAQEIEASPAPKQLAPTRAPAQPDSKPTSVEVNYATYAKMAADAGLTAGQTALLKRIGECESGFAMKPNATGASSAWGIFQTLKVHDARARSLGYAHRYVSAEANIAVAISLYKEQGTTPWNASKHCWGK